MGFYIRYYEDETLVHKMDDIVPYLESLQKLTEEEMEIVRNNVPQLRAGTNRVYLNDSKTRYLLLIGTTQTNLDDFRNNSKARKPEPKAAPGKSAEAPAADSKPVENKPIEAKPAKTSSNAPAKEQAEAQPNTPSANTPAEEAPAQDGWNTWSLVFEKMVDGHMQPHVFRARLCNATLQAAYDRMSAYLKEKYGNDCSVMSLNPQSCWME